MPLPWHARLRAELAAEGGPSIVSPGQALAGVAYTALEHRVLDGDVLVRDRAAPSRGWRPLTTEFIDLWVKFRRARAPVTAAPRRLNPDDPAAVAALDELAARLGYDPREALPPGSWAVAMVDGKPEVMLSATGLRALGMLSEDPRRSALAEAIIRASRR